MPDLNANDLEAAKPKSKAPLAPWASTWADVASGKKYTRPGRPRPAVTTSTGSSTPAKAIRPGQEPRPAKFDETVELAVRLGVDPRKADQMVRGTVALPAGTGKDYPGPCSRRLRRRGAEAGANIVGADDLVEKRSRTSFLDFDVAIATPDLMGQVGKLGRVLGPRGLMPNPKTGTVTTDVAKAVTEFKGGRVEYKTDKFGNVHVPIGKRSFEHKALLENFRAVVDELQRAKPASAKGKYVRSVTVATTMGPGIKVDTNRLPARPTRRMAAEAAFVVPSPLWVDNSIRRRHPVRPEALKGTPGST